MSPDPVVVKLDGDNAGLLVATNATSTFDEKEKARRNAKDEYDRFVKGAGLGDSDDGGSEPVEEFEDIHGAFDEQKEVKGGGYSDIQPKNSTLTGGVTLATDTEMTLSQRSGLSDADSGHVVDGELERAMADCGIGDLSTSIRVEDNSILVGPESGNLEVAFARSGAGNLSGSLGSQDLGEAAGGGLVGAGLKPTELSSGRRSRSTSNIPPGPIYSKPNSTHLPRAARPPHLAMSGRATSKATFEREMSEAGIGISLVAVNDLMGSLESSAQTNLASGKSWGTIDTSWQMGRRGSLDRSRRRNSMDKMWSDDEESENENKPGHVVVLPDSFGDKDRVSTGNDGALKRVRFSDGNISGHEKMAEDSKEKEEEEEELMSPEVKNFLSLSIRPLGPFLPIALELLCLLVTFLTTAVEGLVAISEVMEAAVQVIEEASAQPKYVPEKKMRRPSQTKRVAPDQDSDRDWVSIVVRFVMFLLLVTMFLGPLFVLRATLVGVQILVVAMVCFLHITVVGKNVDGYE
uniref:Uncharacterized protein n=1 Tax=Trieres chinensis TaxID=1514140 RepID=A0A7S1Z299_TRICV|mmetsp:Transcript_16084/g.33026  ORF Transcript_16084/g.33026 Transcript_16084/m.33026 type:complete len:519 (+) Transcript_16084:98-1654(+)